MLSRQVRLREIEGSAAGFVDLLTRGSRSSRLEVCTNRNLKLGTAGSPQSLDVESQEHRYLLCGDSVGSVAVFDTDETMAPVLSRESDKRGRGVVAPMVIKPISLVKGSSSKRAHRGAVTGLRWYPGDHGLFISGCTDKTVKIWDTNRMKSVETFSFERAVYDVALNENELKPMIAVASGSSNVQLVNIRSGYCRQQLKAHSCGVICARWAPADSNILLTGDLEGMICVWDVRSCKSVLKYVEHPRLSGQRKAHRGPIHGLQFAADAMTLFSYNARGHLYTWDGFSFEYRSSMIVDEHSDQPIDRHLPILDLGDVVVVPAREDLALINMRSSSRLAIPQSHCMVSLRHGHYQSVTCLAVRQPYQQVFSGGMDRQIILWSTFPDDHDIGEENLIIQDAWSDDEPML